MRVVVAELEEIAQEEETVIAEYVRLTEDDGGKVSLQVAPFMMFPSRTGSPERFPLSPFVCE